MGKCHYCDTKVGWFGYVCDNCQDKYITLHYKDKVRIIGGFYKGNAGEVVQYKGFVNTFDFEGGDNIYEIKLDNGETVNLDSRVIEKIV